MRTQADGEQGAATLHLRHRWVVPAHPSEPEVLGSVRWTKRV